MTALFLAQLGSGRGMPQAAAVTLIVAGLGVLILLYRRADGRARRSLRGTRAENDATDLRAALNELASAAHQLQSVSRDAEAHALVAEPGTVASLRRTAAALSIVSASMKLRAPFKSLPLGNDSVAALRRDAKTTDGVA